MPITEPLVSIAPDDVLIHTPEFAVAAMSKVSLQSMLNAAKAMSMTLIDLLADPDNLTRAREEFGKRK